MAEQPPFNSSWEVMVTTEAKRAYEDLQKQLRKQAFGDNQVTKKEQEARMEAKRLIKKISDLKKDLQIKELEERIVLLEKQLIESAKPKPYIPNRPPYGEKPPIPYENTPYGYNKPEWKPYPGTSFHQYESIKSAYRTPESNQARWNNFKKRIKG